MRNFVVATKGLPRDDVYMLLSAATGLHVTQVVDGTKGVHTMLFKAIFRN
jgi:acetamidase/formamidase